MNTYIVILAICLGVAIATPDCTTYCNLMIQNCVGSQYYASAADCMNVCASFPIGLDTDTAGNTVGCREYHAGGPAVANATLHCPHASATGGGVCGSYCDAYCNMSLTGCTVANGYPGMGNAALQSYAACSSLCSDYVVGQILVDQSQNTLACRLYHVQVAISKPANLFHCAHSSPNGAGVCGNQCEAYCNQINQSCAVRLNAAQYVSNQACMDYCNNNLFSNFLGAWNDTAGDSVGCRVYHADAAQALNAAIHCTHAGPSGANTCGLWCDVYCDLVQQNCGSAGSNSQYATASACQTACASMATSGSPGDTSGNTVQCRIYHAGVAGNPSSNAAVHCPHAGASGGGVCGTGTGSTATGAGTAGTTKSGASTIAVSVFAVVAMIAAILL